MKDWRIAVASVVATVAVVGTAQAITEGAFRYSSPKVGWFSINPAAMTPDSSTLDYIRSETSLSREGGTAECFATGINLPQGAKVTNLVAWYRSSDIGPDPAFFLQRLRHADGLVENIAQVIGQDDTSQRRSVTVAVATGVGTIDNSRYSYAFRVCPVVIQNAFHSARIRYTYTDAGD